MVTKNPNEQSNSGSDVEKETAHKFDNPVDAVQWLMGVEPTKEEAQELAWYEAMRKNLQSCRAASGLLQGDIAEKLGRSQSEVSRLERSLGPATGIGRIKDYVEACGGQFRCLVSNASSVPDGYFEGVLSGRVPAMAASAPAPLYPVSQFPGGTLLPLHASPETPRLLLLVDEELDKVGVSLENRHRVFISILERVSKFRAESVNLPEDNTARNRLETEGY